jgi:glycosyltransferase involved in cell wall biosynthesis
MIAATWQAAGHEVEVVTAVPAGTSSPVGPYLVTRAWTSAALTAAIRRADVVATNGYSRVAVAYAALHRRRLIVFHQGYQLICSDGLGFRGRQFHEFDTLRDLKLACSAGVKPGAHALMRIPFDNAVKRWMSNIDHVVPSRHVAWRLGLRDSRIVYQPPNPVVIEALAALGETTADARDRAYKTGDIVFFGRLVFEKGCDDLIRAYALWREREAAVRPPPSRAAARLIIYGQGPERSHLEELIRRLGLESEIELRPFLSGRDLVLAARNATVVAIPSRWEEPGATIAVELFACGVAVIASETGAQGEIFSGQGRLFPNGDIEGLSRALEAHFTAGPIYPHAAGDEPWLLPAVQSALLRLLEPQ